MKSSIILLSVYALVLFSIGCIAHADNSSSGRLTQTYHDGCYYLVTPEGGITAKVNQPSSCKE